MTVLIPTTTISVLRPSDSVEEDLDGDEYVDMYEEAQGGTQASDLRVVKTGIRADISAPSGNRAFAPGGGSLTVTALLVADPCGLKEGDVIADERTGERFSMQWYFNYDSAGHFIKSSQAGLVRTEVAQ